ncbi:Tubulin polyglutamylase ttll6 [Eumeta japonica]|uniref:Tubulin polyglutamylase ttll6 n=1 Tax=Eumeta variegata TaxID=151549 RepID=A0A4C1X4V8_EUMVA|nr:Tubulin polyglutamylase ttll6 [Eumeta japonica]
MVDGAEEVGAARAAKGPNKIVSTDSVEAKLKREASDAAKTRQKYGAKNYFLCLCLLGACVGVFVQTKLDRSSNTVPATDKYWVYSARNDVDDKNGLLKHVHAVLERLGYEKSTNASPWTLLWSHDYPFRALYPHLHRLRPHQKVNHFPGTGFITNKVDLATSESKYIPKAFKLPADEAEFLRYAEENKDSLFLEKHNQHRGVSLKNVSEVDTRSGERFVQEFVRRPLLVDGRRFDVGVYVLLTSVDPLRVYWYKGDVLFRYSVPGGPHKCPTWVPIQHPDRPNRSPFPPALISQTSMEYNRPLVRYCPAKYHPFDPKNLDSYVVGDDYLPTWEVPSLARSYAALHFSMKNSFDVYLRSQGKDPAAVWSEVQNAITEVFLKKEHHINEAVCTLFSALS